VDRRGGRHIQGRRAGVGGQRTKREQCNFSQKPDASRRHRCGGRGGRRQTRGSPLERGGRRPGCVFIRGVGPVTHPGASHHPSKRGD
jgi:hypothetical protein